MKYDLSKVVCCGDLFFVHGTSWVSRMIQKVTHSEVNHVGIVYSPEKTFETDICWGKAQLRDLAKYNTVPVIIMRPLFIKRSADVASLCLKYDCTPYSWLDIATNLIFSPFKEEVRKKWVERIGTKKYAICSELTARILYEATGYEKLAHYEGLTPQDLLSICFQNPEHFELVLDSISPTLHPEE